MAQRVAGNAAGVSRAFGASFSAMKALRSRAFAVSMLLLASGTAGAICPPRDPADANNPKAYMSAYIDALVVLRSARDRSQEMKIAKMPMEMIAAFENAKQDYDCARSYIAPYEKSTNQAIQASSQSFVLSIYELTEVSEQYRQVFKDMLDGKPEKPSEHAERTGKLLVEADEAWKFEMNATSAAAIALIEWDAAKKQRLAFTGEERDALVHKLEKTFGVGPDTKGHLAALESSVSVLLHFLTDKGRKTHEAQ